MLFDLVLQFYPKVSTFVVQKKMFDSAPTYKYGIENVWRKMRSKLTSSRKKDILMSCKRRESSYIPQCKTRFPCSVLSHRNSCQVCKENNSEKEIILKQGNHTRYEYMSHIATKPTKWHERPAKTQISLSIRSV